LTPTSHVSTVRGTVLETDVDVPHDEAEISSCFPNLFSSSPLPQSPANFFGRDAIIDDLLGLTERFASLILFGAGGIGKSTIALKFLHHDQISHKFGKRRHFMRCDDLMNSLDGFLGRLSGAIGMNHTTNMAELRSHLTDSPCILVLDGVDSVLDPRAPGAAEITDVIGEFGRLKNVCILATSRMDVGIPDFRHLEVSTLPADGAQNGFYTRCSLRRSSVVDELLAKLDFHPLSIELLAIAVCENDWEERTLLKAWGDGGTSILKASGRQSLEDNIRSILLTPTIQELGATARETLRAIAGFPDGVKEVKLENMFPRISEIGDAVNALCKFSLMYRQDGLVKMLSPFRFYFLESTFTAEDIQHTRRDSAKKGLCSLSCSFVAF